MRVAGLRVYVTPFEPEWEGFATLEISITTLLSAKVNTNEGLCRILFFRSDTFCAASDAGRRASIRSNRELFSK